MPRWLPLLFLGLCAAKAPKWKTVDLVEAAHPRSVSVRELIWPAANTLDTWVAADDALWCEVRGGDPLVDSSRQDLLDRGLVDHLVIEISEEEIRVGREGVVALNRGRAKPEDIEAYLITPLHEHLRNIRQDALSLDSSCSTRGSVRREIAVAVTATLPWPSLKTILFTIHSAGFDRISFVVRGEPGAPVGPPGLDDLHVNADVAPGGAVTYQRGSLTAADPLDVVPAVDALGCATLHLPLMIRWDAITPVLDQLASAGAERFLFADDPVTPKVPPTLKGGKPGKFSMGLTDRIPAFLVEFPTRGERTGGECPPRLGG